MRILADESVDGPLVAGLRTLGHDVVWAAEQSRGASDEALVTLARDDNRVIITSDRDFGELVFRRGARPPGVVLLRIRSRSASALLRAFQEHWPTVEARLPGHFIVFSRGRIRVRPLE